MNSKGKLSRYYSLDWELDSLWNAISYYEGKGCQ